MHPPDSQKEKNTPSLLMVFCWQLPIWWLLFAKFVQMLQVRACGSHFLSFPYGGQTMEDGKHRACGCIGAVVLRRLGVLALCTGGLFPFGRFLFVVASLSAVFASAR